MSNKDVVAAFYEDIWNNLDKSKIPALCHEDFSFRGSLGPVKRGRKEFEAYVDFVTDALADYRCGVQEVGSEGDKAFAKVRFRGIHQAAFLGFEPTGERVEWVGAALFTFRDGRIADLWVLGDVHGLLQQLEANAKRAT